jgi:hypothetical protein
LFTKKEKWIKCFGILYSENILTIMTSHKYICSRVKLAKGKKRRKKLRKRAPIKKTEKKGKLREKVEVENISRPEF